MASKRRSASTLVLDDGKRFFSGPSGRWAAEQMLKALEEGRPISPAALRSLDTLRKDEWIHLDTALVREGQMRLRGVADLMQAGLTIPVPNAMGKMLLQYEKVTDMQPAEVSLSGVTRTENDRQEYELGGLPLPIIHKDFDINIRVLAASRERGEPLDTTQVETSGRLVSETCEQMLFQGGKTFGGNRIWGYTNHPDRNQLPLTTNWAVATGEQILAMVLLMVAAAQADRFYGPYALYVPSAYSTALSRDFKANSDKSTRTRLMEIDGLEKIQVVDQLPADNVVLVQMTRDVACIAEGEQIQSIQWDVEGGFIIKFKAFAILIPLIRSDAQHRSGVVHMS